LSCDRCEHIHEAQKAGRTHKACECDCHNGSSGGTDYVFNITPDGSAAGAIDTTLSGDISLTGGGTIISNN